jgi:hypothetical protein
MHALFNAQANMQSDSLHSTKMVTGSYSGTFYLESTQHSVWPNIPCMALVTELKTYSMYDTSH